MAIPHSHLQPLNAMFFMHKPPMSIVVPISPHFTAKTRFRFPFSVSFRNIKPYRLSVTDSAFADGVLEPNEENRDHSGEVFEIFRYCVRFIQTIMPGGSWWSLCDSMDEEIMAVNPVTVLNALCRIWELVADDRLVIYAALGSLIIAVVSKVSIPSILAASIFSAQSGETALFYRNSQLLVLLCLASGISSGLQSGCFGIANIILVKRLRESLYAALIFQDISFFDTEAVGDLTSRLGADCQRLSHVIGNNINMILHNVLQGIGALINLLSLSWPLALSTLAICSCLFTTFFFYGLYQKKASKLTQEYLARANNVAEGALSLMRDVRVYGTERKEVGRYKQWLDKIAYISLRDSMAYGFWSMSFSTLYRSTQVLAVLFGGMSILTGHVSAEQLTKYVLYCEWLIYATWRLVDNLSSLFQSIGASEKVFELMDLLPSDQFLSKGVKLQRLLGHIQFVNVSFHYPSREMAPILNCVNFSLQANEMVAIVGPSGSGKSTLVNLLLRLYEPISGQIYIDGYPLRDLDIRWLREKIGFVGQEPHLFRMDVQSNIKYGCSRQINLEDIEGAAKLANVHDFISSLPDGYETIVDDDLISGGQKQRIAFARAILRNPNILILDEATSALDSESEHYVKGVLTAFRNDTKVRRTIIVIAHRLSTIKAADRIIVMDNGQIIEMGNHPELLLKNGLYARLFKVQTDSDA